jgi:peptidoglycan glycosyltransferase
MSRRLGAVGVAVLILFVALAGQAAYLQFFHATQLNASALNPRVQSAGLLYPRGDILAANDALLAHSVPSGDPDYPWRRIYPLGSLTAGVVGFNSNYQGAWGLERQYQSLLVAHRQGARSWIDLLAPQSGSDSIMITLEPALQAVAQKQLAGRDGAVVALDPHTGAVLAMYSNPTYDPMPITSPNAAKEAAAWKALTTPNANHFEPLAQLATQWSFPPGSTFKVVTTAAAVRFKPDLAQKYYPATVCFVPPNGNPAHPLCNDSYTKCGGNVAEMLPPSCDTGYAMLGGDLGGLTLNTQAQAFGYNQVPPIDLPNVVSSYFPSPSTLSHDIPQLEYSAIGQQDVRATALQNALVAAGVANQGVVMTPHLLSTVIGPNYQVVSKYRPMPWLRALTAGQAGQIVPLMQNVVKYGTASGVGFLPQDDVAAKTGTAQTGTAQELTDDWMIAFAPASAPKVAVAVVLPFQPKSHYGATYAGPVVKCVIEAALAIDAGKPASGTSTTCP